jgi:hypothetical protein
VRSERISADDYEPLRPVRAAAPALANKHERQRPREKRAMDSTAADRPTPTCSADTTPPLLVTVVFSFAIHTPWWSERKLDPGKEVGGMVGGWRGDVSDVARGNAVKRPGSTVASPRAPTDETCIH